MKIGENIKRIRTAKKLSQKEVISVAHLDSAQYSRIENSKTDPTVTTQIYTHISRKQLDNLI